MFTAVYLPTLLLSFCNGLLVPTLPLFATGFGVSLGLVGLVLAGEALGTLLADLPAGSLLRRFDHKAIMIVGVALVAASVLLLVPAHNVAVVFVLRLVSGVGTALWNLSRHAFLTEATHAGGRGRAISTFGGITRIGSFVGPAAGGVLAGALGLRAPFVLYAVVAGVALACVVLFVRATGGGPQGLASRDALAGPRTWSVVRERRGVLLTAGGAQLMAQMLRAGRKVLLPLYASQVLGLDVGAVGLILSVSAFVDMSLFYPAGWLMDRRGRKFAIVPSFVFQAAALALVPLTHGFAALMGVGVLLGIGNGFSAGTMMTLGADLAPRRSLGEFLGVWRLIGDAGSTGGPLLVGAVAGALDLGVSAVAVAAVGLAGAVVFAYRVPETLRREPLESP